MENRWFCCLSIEGTFTNFNISLVPQNGCCREAGGISKEFASILVGGGGGCGWDPTLLMVIGVSSRDQTSAIRSRNAFCFEDKSFHLAGCVTEYQSSIKAKEYHSSCL